MLILSRSSFVPLKPKILSHWNVLALMSCWHEAYVMSKMLLMHHVSMHGMPCCSVLIIVTLHWCNVLMHMIAHSHEKLALQSCSVVCAVGQLWSSNRCASFTVTMLVVLFTANEYYVCVVYVILCVVECLVYSLMIVNQVHLLHFCRCTCDFTI